MFDAGIIVDKPSGSTTEITQALDAGPLFITKNNYLKEIKDEDVIGDVYRFELVSKAFAEHQDKYGKMLATYERMGIFGTLRLSQAWQNTCVPMRAIASFKATGQSPFDPNQVISNCTAKMTYDEKERVLESLETLSTQYKINGELVDKDFNDCNIASNDVEGAKLKENLTTCRQRTIRLTHVKTQERLQTLLVKAIAVKGKKEDNKKRKADAIENGELPKAKKKRPYKPRQHKKKDVNKNKK